MKKTVTLFFSGIVMFCSVAASGLYAQTVTVTNSNDTGAGSFRQAVADVAAGGTIAFDADTNGDEIVLASAVTINKNITITGNGSDQTVFSGNSATRIFTITGGSITINDVAFTNGMAAENGGAIHTTGSTVTFNDVLFTENHAGGATAGQGGGAIFAESGTVTVNTSTFTANEANGAAGSGGAILASTGATLNVTNSTFTENNALRAGGAIEGTAGATINLTDATISDNTTGSNPGNGGGLHVTGAGNTTITGGLVSNNWAAAEGGGLWNGSGTMSITGTVITENTASGDGADQGGGGIYNLSGTVNINAETEITDNVADGDAGSGGGILNDVGASLSITYATISGNVSNRAGGGIEDNSGAAGTFTMTDVMLTGNTTNTSPGNGGGLHITGAGSVTITGGTVSDNEAGAEGGGLWNGTGTMSIDGTLITNNTAAGAGADQGGGGIYNLNGGTVTVINATISNNSATGTAGSGGGILNDVGSQLTVTDTEITGNTAMRAGGGIEDNSGTSTIVLNNVTLTDNNAGTAPGNGGGLHITGTGSATINGGLVADNIAVEGGGLWNATGTLTVNNVTITGNTATGATTTDGGGGIFNNGGTLAVNRSTISGNSTTGLLGRGGGIHVNGGTATVMASTISANTALANGGGIYNNGTLTVNANTITLNSATVSGGGIYNNSATGVSVKNTISAGNLAVISGRDIFSESGPVTSLGYNIIGMDDADDFEEMENDMIGTLTSPFDAGLIALADNGGDTFTHALDCPNPGADMGDPADTFEDQLGNAVFNGTRDIGAFEAQEVCSTTGLDDFAVTQSVIYPNPANSLFNLELAAGHNGQATVAIYEIASGKLVKETAVEGSLQITTDSMANGAYVMKITSDAATETHKLMVNR
ncbi:right-handed parallel beta-helix repeat-containing protein [Flavobacterium akiainvivens]|uniref:right-handed parallel beta-helix repeat-containing protein n=1 Tax=Flavobacterium akiainvivens TaxID=1202724 RepID=UPI0006C86F3E|nr:right-handed parallel beta-helix repeat-containing protein [Flavobacterium akiainvivens]SFQ56419.1 Por secretion system C-terminal sorting domain-containing protein [Flavobacterium akiainvivens]